MSALIDFDSPIRCGKRQRIFCLHCVNQTHDIIVLDQKSQAPCSWRQTGGCTPSGQREPSNDRPCDVTILTGHSGFCDCNGNGVYDADSEQGYDCASTPGTCSAVCQAAIYGLTTVPTSWTIPCLSYTCVSSDSAQLRLSVF